MRFVVAAALLLLLAGCADKAGLDADEGTTTDGTVPVQAEESRKSPAREGTAEEASPGEAELYVTDFSESGIVPPGAMVPMITSAFILGSDRWFPVDVNGSVQDVSLTMTWEAENPTTERLLLAFGKLERDGGRQYSEVYRTVIGTSPLELALEGLDWTVEDYVVWAWYDYQQPAVLSVDQPFAIEGTITSMA